MDRVKELKKLWNMKVTVIPIVIGAFLYSHPMIINVTGGLTAGERGETIQTIALLRTDRIPRRVLESWGDLLSNASENPSAKTDIKYSQ